MLVTRHKTLKIERSPFFIDWMTLRQTHDFDLPEINAGVVTAVDVHGELIWRTTKATQVQGSFDTSVQIRCDGNTVNFSGNVSRFGRTNNLFGYDLNTCINRVNQILARFGLPPFTLGQKFYRHIRTSSGPKLQLAYTGCIVTRLDLCANFETGSLSNARAYLAWLQTQQTTARIKVGTHGDGETVTWGEGSRRLYSKCYLKSKEIIDHNGPQELIEHCEAVGLVRFELTVKATQLHTMGCNYLGGLDMNQLELLFEERKSVMTRAEHTHDDLEELPNNFRRTVRDWLAGDDLRRANGLRKPMAESTFRKHRAGILPYGIDIAVKRNVVDFKPRIRVIEVRAASAPSWYDFDERLAA